MKGYGQRRYLQEVVASLTRNDRSTTNAVLNGFGISDAKVAVLAMALVHNTHLRTLHLDGNAISDRGAVLLAYALRRNGALEVVSLNDNAIGPAGADAIAGALAGNGTLRTLRLANNGIGDRGAEALRRVMERNGSIGRVVLDGDAGIGPEAARSLDGRCGVRRGAVESGAACDATAATSAASTAESDVETRASTTEQGNEKKQQQQQEERDEESNTSTLEWAEAMSLFDESLYMGSGDARKYIIGGENESKGGDPLDAGASWNDLASYMMAVQETIRSDGEDDIPSVASGDDDDDILSVASDPDEVPAAPRGKKQGKKFRSMFKRMRIHPSKARKQSACT